MGNGDGGAALVKLGNARTRNHAIEGRDLFIAVRVATPKLIMGQERKLGVTISAAGEASARIGDSGSRSTVRVVHLRNKVFAAPPRMLSRR